MECDECRIEQSAWLTGQLTKKLRSPKALFYKQAVIKRCENYSKLIPAFERKWLDAKAPWGHDLRVERSLSSKMRISDRPHQIIKIETSLDSDGNASFSIQLGQLKPTPRFSWQQSAQGTAKLLGIKELLDVAGVLSRLLLPYFS